MEVCACDHLLLHMPVYALCHIPAILHKDLWVKTEPTQPRCGADLTHAVSLIVAPLMNTNVHLLWLRRLNRCLVSIQSQILWSVVSALVNSSFPTDIILKINNTSTSVKHPLSVYGALNFETKAVANI